MIKKQTKKTKHMVGDAEPTVIEIPIDFNHGFSVYVVHGCVERVFGEWVEKKFKWKYFEAHPEARHMNTSMGKQLNFYGGDKPIQAIAIWNSNKIGRGNLKSIDTLLHEICHAILSMFRIMEGDEDGKIRLDNANEEFFAYYGGYILKKVLNSVGII